MAGGLFELVGVPFADTSELQRQLIAAFSFGMVFAVGQAKQLSPPDVHALVISCLMDVFNYSATQAADLSALLIEATFDAAKQPVMNAIIHRGIDGHLQWVKGAERGLRANVTDVLRQAGA